jgi:hypothetical protein
MLQVFVRNICSRRMLQVLYLVLHLCCNDYVAGACSDGYTRMLQLLYLSVAKVELDVGLLSEKERASVGAMAASGGKLAAALHRRMCRVTSMHVRGPRVGPHRVAVYFGLRQARGRSGTSVAFFKSTFPCWSPVSV